MQTHSALPIMIKSILMNSLAIADRHMNFAVTGFKMLTLSTSLLLHPHTGNGRPFAGPASTHTHALFNRHHPKHSSEIQWEKWSEPE